MEDFKDIAPYDDIEVGDVISRLVKDAGFEHAVRFVMPNVDYFKFCSTLLTVKTKYEFQGLAIVPFLEGILKKTTDGLTVSKLGANHKENAYTYISNHRDIVLDAALLNLSLYKAGYNTTEIAIGDNLLIYDWINDLVRINKSFIVKRGLKMTQAFEASKHLSSYIRHTVTERHQSVWIAQREGRAKDSNDITQESLIKMLGQLSGKGSLLENITALNISPVSISYEFDPNDYLKVKEYLSRRRNPQFHKSKRDDLFSMETGVLGYKGKVHYTFNDCINPLLKSINHEEDKAETLHQIRAAIDATIHKGYEIFKINYIAYDELFDTNRFSKEYNFEDIIDFDNYISMQLEKVDLEDITDDEYEYMREMILQMYANPLKNKLIALGEETDE